MSISNDWIAAAEAQLSGQSLTQEQDDTIVRLLELCADDPAKAFVAISGIVQLDPRLEILNYLGAGPLEDLLIKHCEYLEVLIAKARQDRRFRQCLSHVNLDNEDCPNAQILHNYLGGS